MRYSCSALHEFSSRKLFIFFFFFHDTMKIKQGGFSSRYNIKPYIMYHKSHLHLFWTGILYSICFLLFKEFKQCKNNLHILAFYLEFMRTDFHQPFPWLFPFFFPTVFNLNMNSHFSNKNSFTKWKILNLMFNGNVLSYLIRRFPVKVNFFFF